MNHLAPYLRLARPRQWVKNLLVFAPAFFAGTVFAPITFVAAAFSFIAFCLAASAVYVLNDIVDCEADKKHPKKSLRPLPSGAAKKGRAAVFGILLLVACFAIALVLPAIILPLIAYLVLNVAYSMFLKHVAVVDAAVVAIFYVMRIAVGGAATMTLLSPWIILATFFLALFIVAGKRKGEYERVGRRKALDGYAPETSNGLLLGSAILAIASYGLWAVLLHPSLLAAYSVAIVFAGIFRMLNQIYLKPEDAETPEVMLFSDAWTLVLSVLWLAAMFGMFYL